MLACFICCRASPPLLTQRTYKQFADTHTKNALAGVWLCWLVVRNGRYLRNPHIRHRCRLSDWEDHSPMVKYIAWINQQQRQPQMTQATRHRYTVSHSEILSGEPCFGQVFHINGLRPVSHRAATAYYAVTTERPLTPHPLPPANTLQSYGRFPLDTTSNGRCPTTHVAPSPLTIDD